MHAIQMNAYLLSDMIFFKEISASIKFFSLVGYLFKKMSDDLEGKSRYLNFYE